MLASLVEVGLGGVGAAEYVIDFVLLVELRMLGGDALGYCPGARPVLLMGENLCLTKRNHSRPAVVAASEFWRESLESFFGDYVFAAAIGDIAIQEFGGKRKRRI